MGAAAAGSGRGGGRDVAEWTDAASHQEAVADALAAVGYPRGSIDTVIAAHIDGIGMIGWRSDDQWRPFFPNAEVLLSRREYEAIIEDGAYRPQGSDALVALGALGVVRLIEDAFVVTDDVMIRWTGGHSPGHQIVKLSSRDAAATMIGHLALNPPHCALSQCTGHIDPAAATLRELRDSWRILIGPLWPTPGATRWTGTQMLPIGEHAT